MMVKDERMTSKQLLGISLGELECLALVTVPLEAVTPPPVAVPTDLNNSW